MKAFFEFQLFRTSWVFGFVGFIVLQSGSHLLAAQELVPIKKHEYGDLESFDSPVNSPKTSPNVTFSPAAQNPAVQNPAIGSGSFETLPAPQNAIPDTPKNQPIFRRPLGQFNNSGPIGTGVGSAALGNKTIQPVFDNSNRIQSIPTGPPRHPIYDQPNVRRAPAQIQQSQQIPKYTQPANLRGIKNAPPSGLPTQFRRNSNFQNRIPNQGVVNQQLPVQPVTSPQNSRSIPTNQKGLLQDHTPLFAMPPAGKSNVATPSNATPVTPVSIAGTETIRERFPDGKIKLERQVKQDEQSNYVNHGSWKRYQSNGQLIAIGSYKMGKREGTWARWYFPYESEIFQSPPYSAFTAPFLSKATFRDGKLDGVWMILDKNQRKISEIGFSKGVRNGLATWFFPNGQQMREMNFKEGRVHGPFRQWDEKNRLIQNFVFRDSRQVIEDKQFYDPEKKIPQIDQAFLGGLVVELEPDNWWDSQLAIYTIQGEQIRHGQIKTYFPNGQLQMQGTYDRGLPVGQFVWYHANGQKQIAGQYESGTRTDQWVWWHENGMKSQQGRYIDDQPQGMWAWWDEKGALKSQKTLDGESMTHSQIAQEDEKKPSTTRMISTQKKE